MSTPADLPKGKMHGAQEHAEGEHGERTHARIVQQLQESPFADEDNILERHREEKHRLQSHREQHDQAEERSEHAKREAT